MSKNKNQTYKLILFFAAGIAALILIAKCNESFDADTPGKDSNVYYGQPKIESHGDTMYNNNKP